MPEPKPSVIDQIRATLTENRDALKKSLDAEKQQADAPAIEAQPETPADDAEGEKAGAVSFKASGVSEQGIIYGIGGAVGSPNKLDRDGEFLESGDLCSMAWEFCGGKRTFKANHDADMDCELVESWVGGPIVEQNGFKRTLKASETFDPSTMTVIGIDTRKGYESHWMLGVRPKDPEIVKLAKAGGIAGFSWGSFVEKREV